MKTNQLVIDALAQSAEREIAAITAYSIQAVIQEKSGYAKIAKESMSRAQGEMHHLDSLIERTVELGVMPEQYRASEFSIGSGPKEHVEAGLALELEAVDLYNGFVTLCQQVGDEKTRELFSDLVSDEEEHVVYLRAQLTQIEDMTLAGWLQTLI